jgi:cobalt/nickel transport system permease protein
MSDALLSPVVGGAMLAVSAGAIGLAVKKTAQEETNNANSEARNVLAVKIPLMGVMGAFVFAGQMINFTIPGTGSSGHIGGGILLAAVLGAGPALITLAGVLLIQCLFFADGGLLAYGCNVFNMGVVSCMLAYTFIYKPITRRALTKATITTGSILAVLAGLQAGAFAVVLETTLSGVTELPFGVFVLLMQPIHLAIGLVEGIVTAAVLCYVHAARPELLEMSIQGNTSGIDGKKIPLTRILITLAVLTVITAAGLSIFASAYPDGLEWSIEKTAGTTELEREGGVYDAAAGVVEKTAFMPDYGFKKPEGVEAEGSPAETASAGIVGSIITLALACGAGLLIHAASARRRRAVPAS